ncbi:MAG: SCO family protein [Candidatus Thiodiazotropha sp.]
MQKPLLIAAIALLMGLLSWMLFGWQPVEKPASSALQSQAAIVPGGGDFTLRGAEGPVRLADFRGQVVLLYFGYTWCPDICPTNLAIFSQVLHALKPEELAQVQPIFISVDPRRDDQARLKEYTGYFHPRLIGVTGSDAEVARVAALYGVIYRAVNSETEANYAVDHTADTYLIDQQGGLVRSLPHGTNAESLLKAIRDQLSGDAERKAG